MLETYTPEQQSAIEEKYELFKDLEGCPFGKLSDVEHKIRNKIYWKRIKWLDENFERVSKKLRDCKTPVEKAFMLVFFEYMRIDPKDVEFEFIPKRRNAKAVYIRSNNFCPYHELFTKKLKLDSRKSVDYCRYFLEGSVERFANTFLAKEGVKYGIWFKRNYYDMQDEFLGMGPTGAGIRPLIDHCQEYFIDRSDYFEFRALEEMCQRNLQISIEDARKIAWFYR